MVLKRAQSNESGQAVTEYILLVAAIVGAFLIFANFAKRFDLAGRFFNPIKETYTFAYKYGHPEARGFEEGTPKKHPRINQPAEGNYRIFYVRDH